MPNGPNVVQMMSLDSNPNPPSEPRSPGYHCRNSFMINFVALSDHTPNPGPVANAQPLSPGPSVGSLNSAEGPANDKSLVLPPEGETPRSENGPDGPAASRADDEHQKCNL